jgi:hypothetical protein
LAGHWNQIRTKSCGGYRVTRWFYDDLAEDAREMRKIRRLSASNFAALKS